jgi:hypothetical protein
MKKKAAMSSNVDIVGTIRLRNRTAYTGWPISMPWYIP